MRSWKKYLKWSIAISMVALVFAIAPVVYGGLRWTGIDPVVDVGEHTVGVTIAVPPDYWCSIIGPIIVAIAAPEGTTPTVLTESSDPTGEFCGARTVTVVYEKRGTSQAGVVDVAVMVFGRNAKFPVDVGVAVDGTTVQEFSGRSNQIIHNRGISLGD